MRVWIARINALLQENITGMATVQLFRREPRSFAEFDAINRRPHDRQRAIDLLLRGVLSGDRDHQRARHGAHHLVRRRARDARTL